MHQFVHPGRPAVYKHTNVQWHTQTTRLPSRGNLVDDARFERAITVPALVFDKLVADSRAYAAVRGHAKTVSHSGRGEEDPHAVAGIFDQRPRRVDRARKRTPSAVGMQTISAGTDVLGGAPHRGLPKHFARTRPTIGAIWPVPAGACSRPAAGRYSRSG